MDIWLSDDRPASGRSSHNTREGKNKKEESPWMYPLIEEGSLTVAGLNYKDGRLRWTFPSRNTARRLRVRGKGTTIELFPPTYPLPARIPHTSIQQRAEQGANFIRTYFPDVDIPGELLREEIASDMQASQKLQEFDPYVGDTLELVECYDGLSKRCMVAAFPMGESRCDLNISPFAYDKTAGAIFKPLANSIKSFETPIMQITSYPAYPGSIRKSLLAVRTFASTALSEINAKVSGGSVQTVSSLDAMDLGTVNHSELGSRHIVDMKIRPSTDLQLVFADDAGNIHRCRMGGGKRTIDTLHSESHGAGASPDHSRRITFTKNSEMLMLLSSSTISQLDFRSMSSPSSVFSLGEERSVITHIDTSRSDHLFCITTTGEILWIDERFTRKPVLGHRHKRQFDRSLFTLTTDTLSSPLTLLACNKNELITVYDVSREERDGLLYSNVSPYSPGITAPPRGPYAGSKLFVHSLQNQKQNVSLVRLSYRGGLYCTDYRFSPTGSLDDDSELITNTKCEWSSAVRSLGDKDRLHSDVGPLGGREFTQIDLWPAYERLFVTGRRQNDEQDPEAVYELLEKMPTFKQNIDEPVDNMLTTFDIAFRSGDEPSETARADFITQSALSSTRGYRALIQGRIPKTQLIGQIPWHKDITPFLRHFDPDAAGQPKEILENLHRYDLTSPPERPGLSYRFETEAREQLTLDLALSSDVFSVNPFHKAPREDAEDAFETMSRATESMSLSVSEPPAVQFGYLRPEMKGQTDYYSEEEVPKPAAQGLELPIGARLLLQEWRLGEDPNDYAYQDPYNTATSTPGNMIPRVKPAAKTGARGEVPARSEADSQSRPPMVVAARTAVPVIQTAPRQPTIQSPDIPTREPLGAASQPAAAFSQSQDMIITNTQILPGPFGGRLATGKKKVVKKRMGGF